MLVFQHDSRYYESCSLHIWQNLVCSRFPRTQAHNLRTVRGIIGGQHAAKKAVINGIIIGWDVKSPYYRGIQNLAKCQLEKRGVF